MSLFVGGLMDGGWHRVERMLGDRLPQTWTLADKRPAQISYGDPSVLATVQDGYKLMEFKVDGNTYHVYRHYKLKPTEAFEMILRGYVHKEIEA